MCRTRWLPLIIVCMFVIGLPIVFGIVVGLDSKDILSSVIYLAVLISLFFVILFLFDASQSRYRWLRFLVPVFDNLEEIFPMNIIAPEIRLREQFIETGAYFYTRRSADSRVNICEAGIENETWQQCMIAIWENYAAVYPRSFFMRYVITFNRQNIRWVGRVQNVTNGNNFDQIALDIHMNDRWYTLTFRLLDSDMRRFEEEILRLRPSTINSERSRRRPNIRSGPFVVHPVGGPLVDIVDTALIYVTPLWLVILANGVVLREFPLDAIKKYNVLESLNQLRLDTGEETWAFEISDNQSTVLKELIRVLSKSSP